MIVRIRLLRNIGQFDSVSAGATIPLARLTLVYSENGRGKTTLAAVLRSLATGDPVPIAERRRLAAQHPPHVVVECSGGPQAAIFENNAWNRTLPRLMVFDDVFIDENVHSGLTVQAHHRQNLHELILGAQAVALSRGLQELVARIETHNKELRAKERAISWDAKGPYSVDQFCALPGRADIDDAIQEAARALAAAREQDPVRTTPSFQSLNLPGFDLASIERLLRQDLPALDSATLRRIQAHLASIGQGAEAWVADGIRRTAQGQGAVGSDACPFCGQALGGSALIQHYRAYFSDAYASLKRDVSTALAAVNQIHGREVPAGFERALRVTVERRQFWSRFCEVAEVTLDTAAIVRDWEAAREAVVAQLSAKQAAPLEAMQLSAESRTLVSRFEAHRDTITAINQRLREANQAIEVTKERVANANPTALADDLARLKAIKRGMNLRLQRCVTSTCRSEPPRRRRNSNAIKRKLRWSSTGPRYFLGTRPPSTSTSRGSTLGFAWTASRMRTREAARLARTTPSLTTLRSPSTDRIPSQESPRSATLSARAIGIPLRSRSSSRRWTRTRTSPVRLSSSMTRFRASTNTGL